MAKKKNRNKKKNINTSQFKFRKNDNIGCLDAANDGDFLEQAFFELDTFKHLVNMNSPKFILVGRTGIGKTAMLSNIDNEYTVVRIEPHNLPIEAILNTGFFDFFSTQNIKLDLIHKAIWKHFFISYLTGYFNSPNFFLKDKLKKYSKKIENGIEHSIKVLLKDIDNKVEKEISTRIGIKPNKLNPIEFIRESKQKLSDTKESKQIMNTINALETFQEIQEVINLLRENKKKIQEKVYILIDDLDKVSYLDDQLTYDVLRNLMEAAKEVAKISNVKIIIALRDNLLRLIHQNAIQFAKGFQREKESDFILKISWDENDLKSFVNKRLEILFKDRYTNASPTLDDVIKPKAWDYLVMRSLYRPRDIMAYINLCLGQIPDEGVISLKQVKNMEQNYSDGRLRSLCDEWNENFGDVAILYTVFENSEYKFPNDTTLVDKFKTYFEENFLKFEENTKLKKLFGLEQYDDKEIVRLKEKTLSILYDIGLIGVKKSETTEMYSYKNANVTIDEGDMIYIHPMYCMALKCKGLRNRQFAKR